MLKDEIGLVETLLQKFEKFFWTQCKSLYLKISYGEIINIAKYVTQLWRQFLLQNQNPSNFVIHYIRSNLNGFCHGINMVIDVISKIFPIFYNSLQ